VFAGDGAGRPAGRHRAPPRRAGPDTGSGSGGRHRAGAPGHDSEQAGQPGDTDMIVGITAAAHYLGYDKPESFRRARTRNPVPAEGKMSDGRPCWTPQALRSWQSKRKIAGNRTPAGEPD
jgi:hypothetical protein